MELNKIISCANCDTPLTDTFCSHCGQKHPQPRLSLKVMADVALHTVVDLDRGFLYTCKELLLRPDMVIHNYLIGKRVIYTNPIKLLLVFLGISTIITFSLLDLDTVMANYVRQSLSKEAADMPKIPNNPMRSQVYQDTAIEVYQFIIHNQQLVYILILPFTALLLKWFFRKQAYNFTEHLVVITYSYSLFYLVSLPLSFLYLFAENHIQQIALLLSLLMCTLLAYSSARFYGNGRIALKSFLKSMLVQVISYIVYSGTTGIFVNLYALAAYFISTR